MVETASPGSPYFADDLCLADGCYTVNMYDAYGDGWNGNTLSFNLL